MELCIEYRWWLYIEWTIVMDERSVDGAMWLIVGQCSLKDEENTGSWETVFIPVTSPHNSHSHSPTSPNFSAKATYTLKNLRSGAVYDIVAKAKNKFGWSQLSKVFNFFNKGVGKCCHVLTEGQSMPLLKDFNHKIMNCFKGNSGNPK